MKKYKTKKYKKIICFDIDNVICLTKGSNYKNAKPIVKNINLINLLYENNFYIKIFTARYMGRYNEDKFKVKKFANLTRFFLKKKCKLKYHELIMGKPTYDLFVDDKCFGFKKSWANSLKKTYLIN
tara:strand:+ start:21361 stop:21738 length:378 start_codon:yes stop_codon:yes gene_type:complete